MIKNWLSYPRGALILLILIALAIPIRALLLGKAWKRWQRSGKPCWKP